MIWLKYHVFNQPNHVFNQPNQLRWMNRINTVIASSSKFVIAAWGSRVP
jgi:hypothetical protein